MSWLLKSVVRFHGRRLNRAFERAASRPHETQKSLLLDILGRNSETEFGRRYGFSNITTEEAFQTSVPVQEYEGLRPYVEKTMDGTKDVLTSETPIRFNVTSGTTGKPKFIPVTTQSQLRSAQLMALWFYRLLQDHPKALDHSFLLIASPAVEGYTGSGIPYGSASGVIYEDLPRLLRGSFAIPFLVSQIKDYNLRYYILARLALDRRVSLIGTANPTTLVRIAEAVRMHQDSLIQSIGEGKLCGKLPDLPIGGKEALVSTIEKGLRPNPSRARGLALAAQRRGYLRLGDCWPELRLIACWLGGSIGSQANKIFKHVDENIPLRDLGYHASEGSFTFPHQDHIPSGILALFNAYYEFVEEDDHDTASPAVRLSHQLEKGKAYSILITTPSGLYRYRINDIVEVTDWYQSTPLLKFLRKGRDMANITGEKVHVNQLIMAMGRVEKALGFLTTQFRVFPDVEGRRYEFQIEFGCDVPADFLQQKVIPGIDDALSEVNIEYGQKRQSMRLNPPCIVFMRRGWEREDRRRYVNSGRKDGQYKWQTLVHERTPVDLAFAQRRVEPPPQHRRAAEEEK